MMTSSSLLLSFIFGFIHGIGLIYFIRYELKDFYINSEKFADNLAMQELPEIR